VNLLDLHKLLRSAIRDTIAGGAATQSQIAETVGCVQGHVSNLLSGRRKTRGFLLSEMAEAAGLDIEVTISSAYSRTMPSDITTGAQTITAAGPVTGTLSTLALTAIPTLKLDILGLTPGSTARIAIEDTAVSPAFNDAQQAVIFDIEGPVGAGQTGHTPGPDLNLSVTPDLIPSLRYGAANCALRANVQRFTGASPSLTIHAYTA